MTIHPHLSAQMREMKAKAPKFVFRDEHGKFVSQRERYSRAVSMERVLPSGKRFRQTEGKTLLTPARVARVLGGNEAAKRAFEAMAPAFAPPIRLRPRAEKFTAWNVAGQMEARKGIRGKTVWVTMNLLVGGKLVRQGFFHKIKPRGNVRYGLFLHMNEVLQSREMYLYNKIGNRMVAGRAGRQVRLHSLDVSPEM